MLRKLVLLALSTGLIKKMYDTYKAQAGARPAPAAVVREPAPMPGDVGPRR